MLEKKYRFNLRKQGDLKDTFQSFFSPDLNLLYTKDSSASTHSRFAIITKKKEFKRAVDRNLIKRRLVSVIQTNLSSIPSGFNLILIPKSSLLQKKYSDMVLIFQKQIKRLNDIS